GGEHRRHPFSPGALLRGGGRHRQNRKNAELITPVDASIEHVADAAVQVREPIPGAMPLPDVGIDAKSVRMTRLELERACERSFRIVVAVLENAQRGDVGMDARVVRIELLRFTEARFGSGELARLHLAQAAPYPGHGGGPKRAMAILEALAAAAGTGGV